MQFNKNLRKGGIVMFWGNSVIGMGNTSISFSKRSGKDKQESQGVSEAGVDEDEGEFKLPPRKVRSRKENR